MRSQTGIGKARVDGSSLAVAEEDLDELEAELRRIECGELVVGVGGTGL
jgi:hypothetical protein